MKRGNHLSKTARVKFGVQGFDEIIAGGFPKGFNILLLGAPGTGKTVFGLQYIYNGALCGEKGVFVTLESSAEELKRQAAEFGWDFAKLEAEGKVSFIEVPVDRVKWNLFDELEDSVAELGASRLVFDSLSAFSSNIDLFTVPIEYMGGAKTEDEYIAKRNDRRFKYEVPLFGQDEAGRMYLNANSGPAVSEKRVAYLLLRKLKTLGTTNLIASASANAQGQESVAEFACDGAISFDVETCGNDAARILRVLKMRDTKHGLGLHEFSIAEAGICLPIPVPA